MPPAPLGPRLDARRMGFGQARRFFIAQLSKAIRQFGRSHLVI
jgi:hypothetical protein